MPQNIRSSTLLLASSVALLAATSAARAETGDQGDRDAIVVTGQKPAGAAAGGTKTDTPVVETPQSISVITRADLDVQGVGNLNQALRYTAGITPELRGANAEVYDQFKLRGFDVPQYLDGLRVFASPTGYAATQIDTSRLDRIEVVKGPASVLYGQSSPGGLVAQSSKLPGQADPYGSIAATYGTFDLYRVDADVGGALSRDGHVLYRLYGSVNGADTQQTFGKRRRYTISPSVTLGAGTATTLTLLGNYSHDPFNGNYGVVPLSGSLDPNPNGRISRMFADGEPDLQRFRRDQYSGTYLAAHDLGGGWAIRLNGRYQRVDGDAGGVYTFGTLDSFAFPGTTTTFGRGSLATREHLGNWTFDNQLAGTLATGPITHKLLFGVDYQTGHATEAAAFGGATDINAYDPVYGTTTTLPAPNSFYDTHQRQLGVYAQDQLALGGFRLTASGRYDRARGHLVVTSPFGNSDDEKTDEKFTYRIGALYLTDAGLAPYASYSTSFQPQSSRVAPDNAIADPSEGRQWEVGAKYQPPGTPILLTASYFHIIQSNVVVSNPLTFAATQSGKVRSVGFELEARVPLTKGLNLTASYSHQKVRTLKDDNPFNLGRPLIETAKENGGLLADYTLQQGVMQGFGFGGGVRHVGRGYGGYITDAAGTAVDRYVHVKPYTLFDATLSYDLAQVSARLTGARLAVNAANVFDKRHVSSCYVNGVQWCWYGQRRTVQATLGYRW